VFDTASGWSRLTLCVLWSRTHDQRGFCGNTFSIVLQMQLWENGLDNWIPSCYKCSWENGQDNWTKCSWENEQDNWTSYLARFPSCICSTMENAFPQEVWRYTPPKPDYLADEYKCHHLYSMRPNPAYYVVERECVVYWYSIQ
jgi:hypothetical protein